jgi:LuxR family maltose regulon positive regulatory protein
MAERTAAPSGGDATGPDVLLATKLYVPRPPAGLVARPRLARALAGGRAGALVLVSAPAGFGKTALLAGWIRGRGRPAGWLSWMPVIMTRPGSGGTRRRPWTRCARV